MRSMKVLLIKRTLPCMAGMLVESIASVVETTWVANMGVQLGQESHFVGSLGIMFTYLSVTRTVGYAFGIGGGCLISRYLGKGEKRNADCAAGISFTLSFTIGLLLGLLGFFCRSSLMSFLGADAALLPYALNYASFLYWSMPFLAASISLACLLRSEGKSLESMLGSVLGVIVNLTLDRLFLFHFNWGLQGVSLAFLIGQMLSFSYLLRLYLRGKTAIRLKLKMESARKYLSDVFFMSIPSLFRQGWIFISNYSLCRVAGNFGAEALSAITVASRLFGVFFSLLLGIGQGYQPVAGFFLGENESDKLKKAFKSSTIFGLAVAFFSGLLLFTHGEWLLASVWKKSGEVILLASKIIRFQAFALPFIPLSLITNMTFHVRGRKWCASFLASCRQGIVFIPLLVLLTRSLDLLGLQTAQPLSDILTFFISIPFVRWFLKDPLLKNKTREVRN